jgi:site-specific recombinase XerD
MNELVPSQRRQSAMLPEHASDDTVITLWLRKYKKHPNTQSAYSADITRFCAFVQKPLREVTLQDLYSYADSLEKRQVSRYVTIGKAYPSRLLQTRQYLQMCSHTA